MCGFRVLSYCCGFTWGFTGIYNFLMTLQILRRNGVLMMQVCWKKGAEIYCIWKENLKLRKHEDPQTLTKTSKTKDQSS